jgi:hypothetical protein
LIGTLLSAVDGAVGQDGSNDAKARASDRAAVAACLKIAADAAKGGPGASSADAPTGEKIDAKAWMAAAAKGLPTQANLTPQAASASSARRALLFLPTSRRWRWQIAYGVKPRSGMSASTRPTNPGRASATALIYARHGASSNVPGLPIEMRGARCRTSRPRVAL